VVQICDLRALILAPGMAPQSEGGVIGSLLSILTHHGVDSGSVVEIRGPWLLCVNSISLRIGPWEA
jgi:hypothetical protein